MAFRSHFYNTDEKEPYFPTKKDDQDDTKKSIAIYSSIPLRFAGEIYLIL